MIRIITARDAMGIPTEWSDYPDREVGEVTGTLALRFDAELMALKVAGLSFCGLKRWTEAAHRARRFNDQAYKMMQALFALDADLSEFEDPEPDADPALKGARVMQAWVDGHPDYFLTVRVGVWSAVNMGGGRMTLLEVLDLAERDIEDIADMPEFIDEAGADEPTAEADEAGKG